MLGDQVCPNGGPDEAVSPSGGDGHLLAKSDGHFGSTVMPQRAALATLRFIPTLGVKADSNQQGAGRSFLATLRTRNRRRVQWLREESTRSHRPATWQNASSKLVTSSHHDELPTHVVIMLGINDCFSAPPDHAAGIDKRIDTMFAHADQLQYVKAKADPQIGSVSTQLNLDPIKGYPENNGVHPNGTGYKQIGASIYAWLCERLARETWEYSTRNSS